MATTFISSRSGLPVTRCAWERCRYFRSSGSKNRSGLRGGPFGRLSDAAGRPGCHAVARRVKGSPTDRPRHRTAKPGAMVGCSTGLTKQEHRRWARRSRHTGGVRMDHPAELNPRTIAPGRSSEIHPNHRFPVRFTPPETPSYNFHQYM